MLRTLLIAPLLGALLVLALPARAERLARALAGAAAVISVGMATALAVAFDPARPGVQFFETHLWNPRLGSSFAVGVDGLSLPLVVLTALLTLVAVLASGAVRERVRVYFALLLVLEAAVFGVFVARDWSLFYVFWELTLIPLFFLIEHWGGDNRHRAALNFVLYTMGGAVFLLVALLVLYDTVPGHSFDMLNLAAGARALPTELQVAIFLGMFIGFGVKMPVFPLHGWLPLAHVEAPSPVSILLSGILLKMGSYGLIRAVEALPAAAQALQGWLAALALASLLYGGVLAWRQRDLKAMVAYSSISHMGVVLLGIAALNAAGLTGAMMQMIAHGLVAGALFLLVGQLYERTHTRDIGAYSSLVRVMPRFAFFMVVALVAAIGLPGTAGFIAELHTLVGGFARWGAWVAPLGLGVLIGAAYAMRTVARLFTGPVRAGMRDVPDLNRTELAAAATLSAGLLWIGFFPAPVLALFSASVTELARVFGS
jgi:NADH-quinone oxidoreductase subunit M